MFRRKSAGIEQFSVTEPTEKLSLGDKFYDWKNQPHGRERATKADMLKNRIGFFVLGVFAATGAGVAIGRTVADTVDKVRDNNATEFNNMRSEQQSAIAPNTTITTLGGVVMDVVCESSVRVDVTDAATQQPADMVGVVNPDITDPATLQAILKEPFLAINAPFNQAEKGQFYFMPKNCTDASFGG